MADANVLAIREADNAYLRTAQPYHQYPQQDVTFAEAAASYVKHGGSNRYLDRVVAYFGDRPLRTIFPFDIREMAEQMFPTQSGATRNRCAITPARAVMLHAYERGWAPLMRIRRFKEAKPKRRKPATPLWLELFVRQCDADDLPHVAALVLFMVCTGARVSEAICLCWSEVDLTARTALLLKTKTTTNSMRHMTDQVTERIRAMQPFRRRPNAPVFRYTSRHSVNERMKAVCERARIRYIPPHTAGRKTFANHAMALGMDVRSIMAAGGWESSNVFLGTYVDPHPQAGRIIADRFNMSPIGDL